MLRKEDYTKTVEFNGNEYTISLDMNAMLDWEELTGNIYSEAISNMSLLQTDNFRKLWFCVLSQEHDDMTLKLAGKIGTLHQKVLIELIYGDLNLVSELINQYIGESEVEASSPIKK